MATVRNRKLLINVQSGIYAKSFSSRTRPGLKKSTGAGAESEFFSDTGAGPRFIFFSTPGPGRGLTRVRNIFIIEDRALILGF